MRRPARKYVLDTNVFIDGLRDPAVHEDLLHFHRAFAPFEYVSAVVVQELRAGAVTASDGSAVDAMVQPFVRRGRLVTPSFRAWETSGTVIRDIVRHEGLDISRLSKSFGNDVLLALSCRESGMTLVTSNQRDFARIHRVVPLEYVAPWPGART
jgi:predicted nucleic acid-binding protein